MVNQNNVENEETEGNEDIEEDEVANIEIGYNGNGNRNGYENDNEDNNEFENHIHEDIIEPLINDLQLVCPVCDLHFPLVAFRNHMLHTHPEFLAIWASALFGPLFQHEEYFTFVRGMMEEDTEEYTGLDVDNMSYEQLLALCEQIGDHKEGVKNVDEVLEELDIQVEQLEDEKHVYSRCPICLEEFSTANEEQRIEKIKSCGHIFCSDCIRKWFLENKQCPFCKTDVGAEMTEISDY